MRTFGTGTLWVFSAVLLQIMAPDKVKGRVFGFEFAALTLTESISVLSAGYIQDHFELPLPNITYMFGWFGLLVFGLWMIYHFYIQKWLDQNQVSKSTAT